MGENFIFLGVGRSLIILSPNTTHQSPPVGAQGFAPSYSCFTLKKMRSPNGEGEGKERENI